MDDDVQNLLKFTELSNAPISDAEKCRLRALISSIRKEIDLIDSRAAHPTDLSERRSLLTRLARGVKRRIVRALISNVRKDINPGPLIDPISHQQLSRSLRTEKSALLSRLESAVSPIRDLPVEIIGAILSSCINSDSSVHLEELEPNDSPWNLAQICSVWRDVALGLPSLWNDVWVYFSCHSQGRQWDRLRDLLEAFLSRARASAQNVTISLHISIATMGNDHRRPPSHLIFIESIVSRVLKPHIGRLRYLGLSPAEAFLPIMNDSGMVQSSQMKSIFLRCSQIDLLRWEDKIPSFDTSNLRRVTLRSLPGHPHLSAFRFPWSQLTHLTISNPPFGFVDGHQVLRQCTSLVSCCIDIPPDSHCGGDLRPIVLRDLGSLTVRAHNCLGTLHGRFLRPLVLPSLKHLDIDSACQVLWSEADVTQLVRHNTPQSVRSKDLMGNIVSAVLTQVPLLTELEVSFDQQQSHSADALLTAIARGDLVPNIQSFSLCHSTYHGRYPGDSRSITIQCRPEEVRPEFWKILVRVSEEMPKGMIFKANGIVFGALKV